jgi:hypothetical protein
MARAVWEQLLLCEQLAEGPKPEAQIEAEAWTLDIPVRSLIAAALGVRCRRGEWWLPGVMLAHR